MADVKLLFLSLGSGSEVCDLVVTTGEEQETTSYNYEDCLTPEVTFVEPRRGDTGGGTSLNITGSGFGYIKESGPSESTN